MKAVSLPQFNPLEVLSHRELIKTLVRRDLKVRYNNSVLGYAWTWLDPLMMMFIFIIVFDFILSTKVDNFPVFLLTGLIPWTFFANTINGSVNTITGNSGLIKRIYYPREIFPLTLALSNFINMLLSLAVLMPVILFFRIPLTAKIFLLPLPVFFLFLLTYGIALFFSCVNVFFRDISYIGPFMVRLWFYLTPIFYAAESRISGKWLDLYMSLNPPAVLLTFIRATLMDRPLPAIGHVLVSFATCTTVFCLGFLFFKKLEDAVVKRI